MSQTLALKNRLIIWGAYRIVILLCVTGAAVSLVHLLGLVSPAGTKGPPGVQWYSEQMKLYASNAWLIRLHLISALIFTAIAPLQFSKRFRQANYARHRLLGKIYLSVTPILAFTGLLLGVIMPYGGAGETILAILLFCAVMTAALTAFKNVKKGDITGHQKWMVRLFAWATSVATMRLLLGMFFEIQPWSDRTWFAISFWASWIINASVAELWIYIKLKE